MKNTPELQRGGYYAIYFFQDALPYIVRFVEFKNMFNYSSNQVHVDMFYNLNEDMKYNLSSHNNNPIIVSDWLFNVANMREFRIATFREIMALHEFYNVCIV